MNRLPLTLTLILLVGCAYSGSRSELAKMAMADQEIRAKISATGATDTVLGKEMLSLDSAHSKELREMLHGRPWFSATELNMRDRISAFMLLQHSPDTAMQGAALPVLKEQASTMGAQAKQFVASLEDRLLIEEGKPQTYGTQVRVENDSLIVYPIADSANVDSRRSSIGLPPLKQYLKMLRTMIPKSKWK